ncbi:MAG: DUF459 domain-containing protein [Hyphomicrobiaceae bacterium]|nr:DUF459 domain-containing protein [Hyphomicrobiaceae bacterium]
MLDGSARRSCPRAAAVAMALVTGLAIMISSAVLVPAPARAQDDWGPSYITPFPENDVYRLQVVGDSMAEGLLGALAEVFGSDTRLQMPRRQHVVGGLIRFEAEDFFKFEETVGREPLHIAVVLIGIADRIALRAPDSRRVSVGSDEWKTEYARRVDRIARALKRRGAAVYWVGLPIVRRPDMNDDVQMLNEVFRERALINNIKFIDVYDAFADETGRYNQYGPDLTGKQRLLREGDGVSFTAAGNRKLAHFVEREIKRDLTQARNDRNIPLAGSEAEQRRISPKPQQSDWAGTVTAAPKESAEQSARSPGSGAPRPAPAEAGSGELKADSAKVAIKTVGRTGREEAITVEILRPAIPASVVALVTRQQSPDRPAQLGDTVPDTLPGGTVVLNSITPGLAAGSQAQRRRLAPTQSPFFKLLVKGERIAPKPGRADDFRWPPPDQVGRAAVPPASAAPPEGKSANPKS